jgi:hypothetical protein
MSGSQFRLSQFPKFLKRTTTDTVQKYLQSQKPAEATKEARKS